MRALEQTLSPGQRIVATSSKRFEALGRQVVRVKIIDDATGSVRELVIDERTREAAMYQQLSDQDRTERRRHHGVASRDLIQSLRDAAGSTVSVDVEVAATDDVVAATRNIQSLDLTVLSTHRRVLTVRGRPDQVRAVSRMDRVTSVGLHHERRNVSLGIARDLDQPAVAVAHTTGAGVGFVAAVWEREACVRRDHPDFSNLTFEPRFGGTTCSIFNQGGHSTAVAGVLAADRGALGTAGLFRGRMFDVDALEPEAEDDMWARKPQIVNASFTIGRHDARDADRAAYEDGVFVFNGSGNNFKDEANCYAYNALCVGAYHDAGTIGIFEDDILSGHSFLNDRYNQREYPQILGPSTARETAGITSPHVDLTGTSAASPGVAGLAGLLLAHQPFLLLKRPALMRAVLMASAQAHPIVDEGRRIPVPTDDIDDRTGVGAPNGLRARSIVDEKTFVFRFITPGTVGTQGSFPVERDERVRVVLAWDQCPGYDIFDPELTADLDLVVRAPNHLGPPFPPLIAHTNLSFSDNWEVVEFIARASGNAEIVVSASRFDQCGAENGLARAPMAIAWTKEAVPPIVK
jgi:subtilisin family serine protease